MVDWKIEMPWTRMTLPIVSKPYPIEGRYATGQYYNVFRNAN
jgi:hypothetical protein